MSATEATSVSSASKTTSAAMSTATATAASASAMCQGDLRDAEHRCRCQSDQSKS
jgi:hypothetical protein